MFRTSYVHHQDNCIVHAALYGMFSMRESKQSTRLKDMLDMYNAVFLKMIVRCSKHVEDKKNEITFLL